MPKEEEKDEKNPLDEFIPVGEGIGEEDLTDEQKAEKEGELEELEEEESEEEESEEERLGAEEGEEEEGGKKARRKTERKTRRERQKAARARDDREMKFLRGRNEQLERRFSAVEERIGHGEVAQIDTRITDVKSKIKLADQVISKAVDSNDGNAMVEAQGIRDNLRDTLTQLNYAKQTMAQSEQIAPDPQMLGHAQQWMTKHTWWDPNGGDADSRTVSRLDNQLIGEGYDPTTQEYWDELSDRVKEAIPERHEESPDNGARKKEKKKTSGKGPKFSTGGRERPLKKNEVYISPERKEAMVQAGVWEDPELRQKYLASYASYDSEHRA